MEDKQHTSLAELVHDLRNEQGISLYELAKRTGINRSTLLRIEDATTTEPDTHTLNVLARELGVEAEVFYDVVWQHSDGPLPTAATYFRSKYHLSDAQIQQLTSTLERVTTDNGEKSDPASTPKQTNPERRSP